MWTRCVIVIVGVLAISVRPYAPATADELEVQWPLAGAVVGEFAAPRTPFGPGRRGIHIAAAPGAPVRAAADGVITFAGQVAAETWVTIEHGNGTATTYGPLAALTVRRGAAIDRGESLGVLADADGYLHWGAKRGGAYIDPAGLVARRRAALVSGGHWEPSDLVVDAYTPWEGARWGGLALHDSPQAIAPGYAVAPTPNHAVVIGGIGTDSAAPAIDVTDLGFDAASVTALSYAGRSATADQDPQDPWRDQRAYGPSDTWAGVPAAAARLEAQLRAIRAREPGRAVDLIGHSMGGIVAAYYLVHRHDPYDVGLPPIGNVVTLASPHRGSDLADLATWAGANPVVSAVTSRILGTIDAGGMTQRERTPLDMPALDQLATGSPFLDAYGRSWARAVAAGDAGVFAIGTRVLTVGGGSDLVATPGNASHPTPRNRAALPSDDVARHVVLPGGHHGVTTTEAVREVMWTFLHGDEVVHPASVFTSNLADEVGLVFRVLGRAVTVSPWAMPVLPLGGR
ncbi:MAG: peptidoglycan DD-metalloendopeptidase family protein [Nitriliruptoraceae bacterium]